MTSARRCRRLIEERNWTHPVGLDRDGALANLYRVGWCPTFVYAFPGGILQSTSIGELTDEQFSTRVERLIQLSEERENPALMTELPSSGRSTPEPGWVELALAEEFLGLSIASTTVETTPGRSPEALRERLRQLSDRVGGAQAVNLRQQPIPWAYRVFFRHIGLDPDTTRTPIEQLIFDRMHDGRFKSRNRVDDALTIAMVEVGVALRARRRFRRRSCWAAALVRGRALRGEGVAAAGGHDRDRG